MSLSIRFILLFNLLIISRYVDSQTDIQQLVYEAHDGNRITGFIYQKRQLPDNAPLAFLMHGLTGSSLHWLAAGSLSYGEKVTSYLIEQGYRVVALDARAHGVRQSGSKPIERVMAARTGEPQSYIDMINATVNDYDQVVTQLAAGKFKEAKRRVVVGYSMGAQMAILLSARNTHISHLITMVPPAVKNVLAVSPSEFAEKVTVPWLLILASEDQFSTAEDNQILIRKAPTSMEHKTFDSGHLLPSEYVIEVTNWIDKIEL